MVGESMKTENRIKVKKFGKRHALVLSFGFMALGALMGILAVIYLEGRVILIVGNKNILIGLMAALSVIMILHAWATRRIFGLQRQYDDQRRKTAGLDDQITHLDKYVSQHVLERLGRAAGETLIDENDEDAMILPQVPKRERPPKKAVDYAPPEDDYVEIPMDPEDRRAEEHPADVDDAPRGDVWVDEDEEVAEPENVPEADERKSFEKRAVAQTPDVKSAALPDMKFAAEEAGIDVAIKIPQMRTIEIDPTNLSEDEIRFLRRIAGKVKR